MVVDVAAVAVNRLDIWVREDVGHAYAARLPLIPGYDIAGTVRALGDGVTAVAVGERVYVHYDFSCGRCAYCLEGDEAACAEYGVMGVDRDGGYAERIVAPVRNLFTIADSLSFEHAAAAGSVYLTAYHMLFSRAGLRPGESVLVTAAGSGVGAAAIALARYAGARVFTTASTEDKRRRAASSGAEAVLDYTRAGWTDELRELTGGRGVDLVVDHVGRAVFADALEGAREQGPHRLLRRLLGRARRGRPDRSLRASALADRLERRLAPRALRGAAPARRGARRPPADRSRARSRRGRARRSCSRAAPTSVASCSRPGVTPARTIP